MPDQDQAAAAAATAATSADEPAAPGAADIAAKQQAENLQRAIAGGYKPEPEPSRADRCAALVAEFEHAAGNGAPISGAMLAELRALLIG